MLTLPAASANLADQLSKSGDGAWHLLKNGSPVVFHNAGGYTALDAPAKTGANAVRVWNSPDAYSCRAGEYRDEAAPTDLGMMLRLGLERQYRLDYDGPDAVAAQREKLREVVRPRRDHPAIWLWRIGNKVG